MGREIRMVPPGWEHPRRDCPHSPWAGGCSESKRNGGKCFQPLYDRSFREAAQQWKDEFKAWERGERPDYCSEENRTNEFWEWDGAPPDREYYRPEWTDAERTHLQIYETVSEGTPVTPVFATRDELVDYLVAHGDYWDQSRTREGRQTGAGWERAAAEKFVKGAGWAPSLVAIVNDHGAQILEPRDGI